MRSHPRLILSALLLAPSGLFAAGNLQLPPDLVEVLPVSKAGSYMGDAVRIVDCPLDKDNPFGTCGNTRTSWAFHSAQTWTAWTATTPSTSFCATISPRPKRQSGAPLFLKCLGGCRRMKSSWFRQLVNQEKPIIGL